MSLGIPTAIDRRSTLGQPVEVGDCIEFIVPHIHGTVNRYDRHVGVRDGWVVDDWDCQAQQSSVTATEMARAAWLTSRTRPRRGRTQGGG
ncbi:MAG: hypothetical protein V5A56_04595 [Halolamina sp.]